VSPSKDPDGSDGRVLELEQLRKRLAELENQQFVGLVWKNSHEDVEERLANEIPVLVPEATMDIDNSGSRADSHVLIEGDNLHALHVLQATHHEAVDVIYIDPPYNTGGEFRYNDKLVDADDEWRHSKWLSFMARRLRLAHNLLPDHGVILISIDDHEQSHLKMLCDKVFGAGNFVAQLVWQGGRKNDSRFVSVGHDYIVVYAKSKQHLIDSDIRWRERKDGADEIMEAGSRCWEESGHDGSRATELLKKWFKDLPPDHPARAHKHYNHVCEITGKVFFPDNISWPNGVGPKYKVLHPVTGKPVKTPSSGWRFPTAARMAEMIAAGKIHFGEDETKVPNRKSYLHEIDSQVPVGVFDRDRRAANKQLAAIIGKGKFEFPKNVDVLQRWIGIVGSAQSLVLDFFAGSGTTLHAVAELNALDGGSRRCILVTNNENEICREVTHPRIKAVLTGEWADGEKHDPLPGSLSFYRTGFIDRGKSVDGLRRDIAKYTVDLIAIKEAAGKVVSRSGELSVLHGAGVTVAVAPGLSADHGALRAAAEKKVRDGDRKVVYVFTWSDQGVEEEVAALWPGWDAQPLPAEMLAALRRHQPQETGSNDVDESQEAT